MTTAPTEDTQQTRQSGDAKDAYLLEAGGVLLGNPQHLDTNLLFTVFALPDVGETTVCNRAFAGSGKIAGDDV